MIELYDPMVAPDPAEWQELSELEAIDLVTAHHEDAGVELPDPLLHATLHVTVENQIAMGQEIPVAATLIRLQNEGLDRHDALHAIAWVLVEHMHNLLSRDEPPEDPNAMCYKQLENLTAERWRRSAD